MEPAATAVEAMAAMFGLAEEASLDELDAARYKSEDESQPSRWAGWKWQKRSNWNTGSLQNPSSEPCHAPEAIASNPVP